MELTKIKGNTYYINAPTNIGVYSFKNKNCLLIDTGNNNSDARKIEEALIENGLHPKYVINTHSHTDHCGGNSYFKTNYTGCQFYTSFHERLYIENPSLFSSMVSSGSPMKEVEKGSRAFEVDFTIDYETNKLNDEKFEIIPLKGHSIEQIGVITPEKVCFLGDAVFSENVIEKYSIPYLYDVEESIKTLNYLKEADADYFVLSHCDRVLERKEFISLVDKNLLNIKNYENQMLDLLDQPLTREDILENLSVINDIPMDFWHYHLNFSSVCSFIKYLTDRNLLDYSIEDGKLYYFKKA